METNKLLVSSSAAGTCDAQSRFENPRVVPRPEVHKKLSCDLSSPWRDSDDIIEEFPFDHELTRQFWFDKDLCTYIWACPQLLPLTLASLPIFTYFNRLNQNDNAYSRWVAVSRENLYIVRRKRAAQFRCSCCDIGETKKVIPISNIQDIMLMEPAGTAVCCFVPNVLTDVSIQTAAAMGAVEPQNNPAFGLLAGLTDPHHFRDVVLALKRGIYTDPEGNVQPMAVPQTSIISRDGGLSTIATSSLPATGFAASDPPSNAVPGEIATKLQERTLAALEDLKEVMYSINDKLTEFGELHFKGEYVKREQDS